MNSYKNQTALVKSCITGAVLVAVLFVLCAAASAQSALVYKLPPAKAFQTFDSLRGSPKQTGGYYFAVSPDERWIATVGDTTTGGTNVMTVVHAATGAKWQHTFTAQTGSVVNNWFPNCFSQDSGSIVYSSFIAKLAENMPELSFGPFKPDPSELKRGTFLGFNGRLKNAVGEEVTSWRGLSQSEGEEGMITWSSDSRVLYQVITDDAQKYSSLTRTPSGKTDQVDYSRLLSIVEAEQKETLTQMREDALRDKSLSAAMLQANERDIAQMKELFGGAKKIRLSNLAVSPNGQYMAALASISAEEMGFGGRSYGVVISLTSDRLVAYPFDVPVYGQMMWSRDAKALYFYSQSELAGGGGDGGGRGTVRKLQLSGLAIGAK